MVSATGLEFAGVGRKSEQKLSTGCGRRAGGNREDEKMGDDACHHGSSGCLEEGCGRFCCWAVLSLEL